MKFGCFFFWITVSLPIESLAKEEEYPALTAYCQFYVTAQRIMYIYIYIYTYLVKL